VGVLSLLILHTATAQENKKILPGAFQTDQYIPLLVKKRVGIFTNHTAMLGKIHLIDTLIKSGITIEKIFTPEHGLRGTADAGEATKDAVDPATGIKVVSLYGSKYGPDEKDLQDIDILVFDIQDVGTRFYTYISSLQYFIEAAQQNNKPLIVLDRPNPNGFYIDGPVLEKPYASFIGKQPIPIVYGMTIGEYAKMLVGEKWIKTSANGSNWQLTVIPCVNYDHTSKYVLDIAPSPNLKTMNAIYWYATTCLVEGTVMSEGRGTDNPFNYIGHPLIPNKGFAFTPISRPGATDPKLKNQICYGWDLSSTAPPSNKIDLALFIEMFDSFPDRDQFFIQPKIDEPTRYYFNKLAGNSKLMQQIKEGKSEKQIRKTWARGISKFKKIRKNYLLYPDFE
jgi:uncharacterized protein YbbC (DUF1343 family)